MYAAKIQIGDKVVNKKRILPCFLVFEEVESVACRPVPLDVIRLPDRRSPHPEPVDRVGGVAGAGDHEGAPCPYGGSDGDKAPRDRGVKRGHC